MKALDKRGNVTGYGYSCGAQSVFEHGRYRVHLFKDSCYQLQVYRSTDTCIEQVEWLQFDRLKDARLHFNSLKRAIRAYDNDRSDGR